MVRLTSTPHSRTGPDLCRGARGCGTRRRSQGLESVKQPLKGGKSPNQAFILLAGGKPQVKYFCYRPFSGRRSRRSVRSGYAFAHSEGFGRLITSGRIMREVKSIFILFKTTRVTSFAFKVGGLGGGRGKGANGQVSGQSSQPGRSTSKSNGTSSRGGGRPGRSVSELTVPPGQVQDF